jgi:phosphoribosylanthranilate isomerase
MSVKVKICGITNQVDAVAAAEAGADALGFMFYDQSPRHIAVVDAAKITRTLPASILRVGVFVNPPEELVFRAIGECGLNLLQFHGDESPAYCTQFGLMSMKAFRIRDSDSLITLKDYPTDAWLLDSCSSKSLGGTGEKFNWDLAVEAKKSGKLIFLAGGLTPANVAEAIRKVRPFGVDVSSGVESTPGKKDANKIRDFISAARSATTE